MKPWKLVPTVAVLLVLLFACSLESPWNSTTPSGEAALPPDKISDIPRSYETFAFETLLPVTLDLEVELYESSTLARSLESLPTQENLVIATLTNSRGQAVFRGSFSADGALKALVAVPAAPEDMVLSLEAPGFRSRSVTIPSLVEYAEIRREMGLMADGLASRQALPDHDGDTVPDVYDADPYDPKVTFKNTVPAQGFLTVAYEDLYKVANAGDADYNDFVAEFKVEESYLLGRLSSVTITAIARRKWAGYNHAFGMALEFDGAATVVLEYYSSEALDGLHKVSKFAVPDVPGVTEKAVVELFHSTKDSIGHATVCTITFEDPYVDPATFTGAPYDPYLYIWNTGYDVHLIGRESLPNVPLYDVQNNLPGDTFQDANGFPWALLVPMGWESPAETQYIGDAYPLFDSWRESFGLEVPSWYLYPAGASGDPGNHPPYPVLAKAPPTYSVGGSLGKIYQLEIAAVDGQKDPDPGDEVYFRSSLLPEGWSLDEVSGKVTLGQVNEPCTRVVYFWSEDEHGAGTIDNAFRASFNFVGDPIKSYGRLVIETYPADPGAPATDTTLLLYDASGLLASADDPADPAVLPDHQPSALIDYIPSTPLASGTVLFVSIYSSTSNFGEYSIRAVQVPAGAVLPADSPAYTYSGIPGVNSDDSPYEGYEATLGAEPWKDTYGAGEGPARLELGAGTPLYRSLGGGHDVDWVMITLP